MTQAVHDRPAIPLRPLRLAFVGTGDWARTYHLPSLDYIRTHRLGGIDLILHGIYGPRQDEARELAQKYRFGRTYETLEQLIDDRDVDSVALVISPEATCEVALQVIVKGVPIFTEKPPGADYAQATRLASQVQVPNVVGFNRRYGLLNNRYREIIQQAQGITHIRGSMYRRNRREEHFVLHTGPHLINFMEYLFGPIVSLRNTRDVEAGTGGMIYRAQVTFASGRAGEIVFSPCSDRHWEGIHVCTGEQTIILHSPHNDAPGEIIVRRHLSGGDEEQVLARSGEHIPLLEEGYAWEHIDLLGTITQKRPTRSNFSNAVNTMRVAEAIEQGKDLTPAD